MQTGHLSKPVLETGRRQQNGFLITKIGNVHREANLKYSYYCQNENIQARIHEQYRVENEEAAVAVRKIIESVQFLARQGLAIQGLESDSGNLMELLRLRSEDVPELAQWLKRKITWTSHDIQNEILEIMAHSIQRDIASDIRDAVWFSLIVDETTDISVKEQVSICLRHVSNLFEVHEDFIGFYETSLTDASTLVAIIEDVLLRLNLPLSQCRGQCYDGASTMAGRLSGVQARILQKCDKAIYVHCCAHSLNLALQDATRSVPMIRDVLDTVRELNNVVRASAKRHALFEKIRADLALVEDHKTKSSLRQLCPTRWTIRASSFQSVLDNYVAVTTALEEIATTDKTDSGSKASGLLKSFTIFDTYFALHLGIEVFSRAEQLSQLLQKKKTNAAVAKSAADVVLENLQWLRTEEQFSLFWERVTCTAEAVGVQEPKLPRRRQPSRRIDCGSAATADQEPVDYFRRIYFEFIDCAIGCITARFNQRGFDVYMKAERLVLDAFNGHFTESTLPIEYEEVAQHFAGDIDRGKLKIQMQLLSTSPSIVDTSILNMQQVSDKVSDMGAAREIFTEVSKLIRLCLTIPVSSATAERSFSALRRLKTFTRSTMNTSRLTHLALLHVHQHRTDKLDLNDICKTFMSRNERRVRMFHK